MGDLQKRMSEHLSGADPEALMKTWLPSGVQEWEKIQKTFWDAVSAGASGRKSGSDK